MKQMKRTWLSLLLALSLTAGLLTTGAGAVTFSDVSDSETARNVAALQMMGVLDGFPDGSFRPQNTLKRAEFCKMTVMLMGKGEEAARYQSYTVFPDVKGSHWAAGYVNLSVMGETRLLTGFPNGTFAPEQNLTFGQAVTILMRLLGYTDADVGILWPKGYLDTAAAIGLTDGLNLTGSSSLTRSQAARLFVNLLGTSAKGGATPYGSSLGTGYTDAVFLSDNAVADDGTGGAIETTQGTHKPAREGEYGVLAGSRGLLVLDENERVLTFVPDRSITSKTFTVSVAKSDSLTDAAGVKYTIPTKTPVYYMGETTTFGEGYYNFRTGTVATVCFTAGGAAEYVFAGNSATAESVVLQKSSAAASLRELTGGAAYTLYKNGAPATLSDLRDYDVAAYDSGAGAVQVCDVKLSGRYEDVYPNTTAPQTVTVMGCQFNVLAGAVESMAKFRIGDGVILLLTADNQVAGAVKPGTVTKGLSSAGIVTDVSDKKVTVELFSGLEVSGDSSQSNLSSYLGQLVSVSSAKAGSLSLGSLTDGKVSGSLNVQARTLGVAPLADNVRVYEKVGRSILRAISLSELTQTTLSSSDIVYAVKDTAGKVAVLVLGDVTGDSYTYGKFIFTPAVSGGDEDSWDYTNATLAVTNGTASTPAYSSGGGYRSGAFGGLVGAADGERIAGAVTLQQLKNVGLSAWNGNDSVTVDGVRYPVSEDVVCYNKTTEKWVTLSAARAFSEKMNLYYDREPDEGGKIRVLEVYQ